MRQEIERCRICFSLAGEGKTVSMVCSGDAGVYGMAAPMYELQQENKVYQQTELVVLPGITAANSGAAVLGAPLNHDYCVISLSDLLTPWEQIEKRLTAAVQGDFAIAVYNPSSHKRADYLQKALAYAEENGAVDGRTAFIAAQRGDAAAQAVVDRYLNDLACGVANIVNIFFPEVIALSGGVANQGDALLVPLRERVRALSYGSRYAVRHTRIELCTLGYRAGVIGAALLAKQS